MREAFRLSEPLGLAHPCDALKEQQVFYLNAVNLQIKPLKSGTRFFKVNSPIKNKSCIAGDFTNKH